MSLSSRWLHGGTLPHPSDRTRSRPRPAVARRRRPGRGSGVTGARTTVALRLPRRPPVRRAVPAVPRGPRRPGRRAPRPRHRRAQPASSPDHADGPCARSPCGCAAGRRDDAVDVRGHAPGRRGRRRTADLGRGRAPGAGVARPGHRPDDGRRGAGRRPGARPARGRPARAAGPGLGRPAGDRAVRGARAAGLARARPARSPAGCSRRSARWRRSPARCGWPRCPRPTCSWPPVPRSSGGRSGSRGARPGPARGRRGPRPTGWTWTGARTWRPPASALLALPGIGPWTADYVGAAVPGRRRRLAAGRPRAAAGARRGRRPGGRGAGRRLAAVARLRPAAPVDGGRLRLSRACAGQPTGGGAPGGPSSPRASCT